MCPPVDCDRGDIQDEVTCECMPAIISNSQAGGSSNKAAIAGAAVAGVAVVLAAVAVAALVIAKAGGAAGAGGAPLLDNAIAGANTNPAYVASGTDVMNPVYEAGV
jgi:hypothetical protein